MKSIKQKFSLKLEQAILTSQSITKMLNLAEVYGQFQTQNHIGTYSANNIEAHIIYPMLISFRFYAPIIWKFLANNGMRSGNYGLRDVVGF